MKTTARTTIQILIGVVLAFLGWTLGRAQTSAPAFEFVVDSPGGETTIECVRGCELAWVERLNPIRHRRSPSNMNAAELVAHRVGLGAGSSKSELAWCVQSTNIPNTTRRDVGRLMLFLYALPSKSWGQRSLFRG
jgi:hypothetical protein